MGMTSMMKHIGRRMFNNHLLYTSLPEWAQSLGMVFSLILIAPSWGGMLNGLLTLREDIVEFLYTWNDIPVPIRHPEDENGFPLPAKDPEILKTQVIGRFFNAHWVDDPSGTGGGLHGEIWFDTQKCHDLGGDALQVLTAVENGAVVEVSTAYYANF